MELGSGVEDQKAFLDKLLLKIKSDLALVELLDLLDRKCSGIQGTLLEQIEAENPDDEVVDTSVTPKNLQFSFSKIGKKVASVIAKSAVIPACLVTIPIVNLLLLPRSIKQSGVLLNILFYPEYTAMLTAICIGSSFAIINDFSGIKKDLIKSLKGKSLKDIIPSRETIK